MVKHFSTNTHSVLVRITNNCVGLCEMFENEDTYDMCFSVKSIWFLVKLQLQADELLSANAITEGYHHNGQCELITNTRTKYAIVDVARRNIINFDHTCKHYSDDFHFQDRYYVCLRFVSVLYHILERERSSKRMVHHLLIFIAEHDGVAFTKADHCMKCLL